MIDLSTNNAPLSGFERPTAQQLAMLFDEGLRSEWQYPLKKDPAVALKRYKLLFFAALILSCFVAFLTPVPSGVTRAEVPTFDPSTVKASAYALVRKPTQDLLFRLSELHHRGVTVRLITQYQIRNAPFQSTAVAPEDIKSEGVLVDGTLWTSIGN